MKNPASVSRSASFLVIFIIYIAAFFGGFLVLYLLPMLHPLLSFLLADVAATIIVWIAGLIFKNSSVYDPYWSVLPPVFITVWIIQAADTFTVADLLFILAVFIWGLRLTANWAMRWVNLGHQDWRYTMLREKSPKIWFLTNLFGINLIPTFFVYMALVPAYFALAGSKSSSIPLFSANLQNLPDGAKYAILAAGFIFCIAAVVLQAISDRQMDDFKKRTKDKSKYIEVGLWKFSRHPNYFGEVLFWWGIWVMQMGVVPGAWLTVIGPVAMTFLFVFISVPMMETHVILSKPGYAAYRKRVSMLVPWPRRAR